jgi:hypothetical protein
MEHLDNYGDNDDIMGEKQPYDRLVDGKDARYKSEYNQDQRSCIAILEDTYEHFKKANINVLALKNFIKAYIELGASVDRKSRKELIDSLKAKIDFLERQQITAQQQNQIR